MYEDIRNRRSVPKRYEEQLIVRFQPMFILRPFLTLEIGSRHHRLRHCHVLPPSRYSHLQSELEAAESYQPVDPWSYQPVSATPVPIKLTNLLER
jgi:hypothetical protein